MTPEERSEAAKLAVEARWRAVKGDREQSSRSRCNLATQRHVSAANSYDAATYRGLVAA
jgi:hypothetical protein